jgi:hypothetical protein
MSVLPRKEKRASLDGTLVFPPAIRISHRIWAIFCLNENGIKRGGREERDKMDPDTVLPPPIGVIVRCIKSQNPIRKLCDPSFNV